MTQQTCLRLPAPLRGEAEPAGLTCAPALWSDHEALNRGDHPTRHVKPGGGLGGTVLPAAGGEGLLLQQPQGRRSWSPRAPFN